MRSSSIRRNTARTNNMTFLMMKKSVRTRTTSTKEEGQETTPFRLMRSYVSTSGFASKLMMVCTGKASDWQHVHTPRWGYRSCSITWHCIIPSQHRRVEKGGLVWGYELLVDVNECRTHCSQQLSTLSYSYLAFSSIVRTVGRATCI